MTYWICKCGQTVHMRFLYCPHCGLKPRPPKKSQVWKLIQRRVKEGWEFQLGRYTEGLQGYWACFTKKDPNEITGDACEECDAIPETDWPEFGHGSTMDNAIKQAAQLTQEEEAVE